MTGLQTDSSGNLVIQITRASLHVNAGALTLTAVPEPGTYALIAGCLALGATMLRRRR
ncbi:MAG: PEP-CTERM sorting domain-containing protein [Opitutaceae bacterium]